MLLALFSPFFIPLWLRLMTYMVCTWDVIPDLKTRTLEERKWVIFQTTDVIRESFKWHLTCINKQREIHQWAAHSSLLPHDYMYDVYAGLARPLVMGRVCIQGCISMSSICILPKSFATHVLLCCMFSIRHGSYKAFSKLNSLIMVENYKENIKYMG